MSALQSKRVAWGSLGVSRNASILWCCAWLGVAGAVVKGAGLSLDGAGGAGTAAALFVIGGVLAVILPSLVTRRVRIAKLARVAFPLDRDAYYAALDQKAERAAFVVEVDLASDVTPDVAKLTMPPTSAVHAHSGGVTFVSPMMSTTRASLGGSYFYNGGLDRWFGAACDGVLDQLHGRHRIAALRVRFATDIEKELAVAETGARSAETALPVMSAGQRRSTIPWLVGGVTALLGVAIAGGMTDTERWYGGVLAGALFTTTLALGAVGFSLVAARGGSPGATVLRRPTEWLGKSFAYSFLVYAIVLIVQKHLWSLGDGPAATWYAPAFFTGRAIVYYFLWAGIGSLVDRASVEQDTTGSGKQLAKLGRRAPRIILVLAATLWLVSLDWVIGLHREALARWLAPLVAANLAAGGLAAAVGVGAIAVRALDGMHLLGARAEEATRVAARWMLGAGAVWIVTAVAVAGATLAGPTDVRAAWEPHVTWGGWQAWAMAMAGAHVLAVLLVAAAPRSPAAVLTAAVLLLAGHALEALQIVEPAALGGELPTWIGLGGFAVALVGVWVVMWQSAGEQRVLPRDPLPTAKTRDETT